MSAAPHPTPDADDDAPAEVASSDVPAATRAVTRTLSFARRLSAPQRLRRVGVAGAAVLLALIVLFAGNSALWQQALALAGLASSSSAATNRYYLAVDVPWAGVTLDDRPLHRPIIGSDPPLVLKPGHHQVGWQAPLFEPQRCTLSVPHAAADTCPVSGLLDFGPRWGQAHLVALHESLANLSPSERTRVIATVQDALDAEPSGDVVQRGETYLTRAGPVTPSAPLRATLRLTLDTDNDPATRCQLTLTSAALTSCVLDGQDCRQFCALPFNLRIPEADIAPDAGRYDAWLVWGLVRAAWDYTTLAGQPGARDQPLDDSSATGADHILLLALDWSHGTWFAVPLVTPGGAEYSAGSDTPTIAQDPVCAGALDRFAALQPAESYTWLRLRSGVSSVAGCVIVDGVGSPPQANATPGVAFEGDGAYYLERFGILYALNVAAHRLHADLPLGGPLQQQAAQLILGGGTWPAMG